MYSHVLVYNPHGEHYNDFLKRMTNEDSRVSMVSNEKDALGVLGLEKDIDLILICYSIGEKERSIELLKEVKNTGIEVCCFYHGSHTEEIYMMNKIKRG